MNIKLKNTNNTKIKRFSAYMIGMVSADPQTRVFYRLSDGGFIGFGYRKK